VAGSDGHREAEGIGPSWESEPSLSGILALWGILGSSLAPLGLSFLLCKMKKLSEVIPREVSLSWSVDLS
jgi:hypothetical protein